MGSLLHALASRTRKDKGGKIPLFFYGTLRNHPLYEKLTHENSKFTPYVLSGYKVYHDKTYPYIRRDKATRVKGELVDVDEKREKILDKWEDRYIRTKIHDDRSGRVMYVYEMKGK